MIDRFHPASGSTPGQILVRVERVADQSAATLALGRARADIANLDGGWQSAPGLSPEDRNNPKFVSGVMTTPSGPFIWIDGGETPAELLATIPELIAQRLAEAGITDALLTSPTGGGPLLDRGPVLEQTYRAVVLRAYPPVPRRKRERGVLPGTWLEEAATWLRQGDPGDRREAMCQVSSVQFSVDLDKVLEFLESCKTQRTSATMVAGNLDRRIRGVRCSYLASPEPSLALAAGGPESGDEELLELFGALREIARRLESAAYAFISLEPTFGAFASNFHSTELVLAGGAEPMWVTYLCDELAFEAYPYQILSPGHLRRLGGPPPGASALDQGRVELSIDQPSSWLLNATAYEPRATPWFELGSRRRDPEVQQRARAILAPCLLSEREVPGKLLKQRYESQR